MKFIWKRVEELPEEITCMTVYKGVFYIASGSKLFRLNNASGECEQVIFLKATEVEE